MAFNPERICEATIRYSKIRRKTEDIETVVFNCLSCKIEGIFNGSKQTTSGKIANLKLTFCRELNPRKPL